MTEGQGVPNIGYTWTSAALIGFDRFSHGFGAQGSIGLLLLGNHISITLADSSEESLGMLPYDPSPSKIEKRVQMSSKLFEKIMVHHEQ